MGSSPRVWGQVGLDIWYQFDNRIIPTRVGTSATGHPIHPTREDHPHACGDKKESVKAGITFPGSSPRVWGQVRKG